MDEFARMSPEEQQEVRERSARSVEEARVAVNERVAYLRTQGATEQEIVDDLRGKEFRG